jgi:hypothetical protein
LIGNGSLASEEFTCSEEITGEKLVALKNPDFTLFSDSEIKILATVREKFRGFTSRRIMEFSHDEVGYKGTVPGQFISYKYAAEMADTMFRAPANKIAGASSQSRKRVTA